MMWLCTALLLCVVHCLLCTRLHVYARLHACQVVVVVVVPRAGLRPAVAQGLLVVQVAAAQGRHGPAVPQLLSRRVDGAEEAKPHTRQAWAPEQDMLGCVRALSAHDASCGGAASVRTLLAGGRWETADAVQVLA